MPLRTAEELNEWRWGLPTLVGFEVVDVAPGRLLARMEVKPELLSPNGFLHGAAVVALADSAAGYGTFADLPDDARGFTTIELKTNFVGTALEGMLLAEATRVHHGKTTQVWDAVIRTEAGGKTIALFRCTQLLLR